MTHRYFNENLDSNPFMTIWEVINNFTNRYSNPNASEGSLLESFYPQIDKEAMDYMTIADCAVRFLMDCKTWQQPSDSQHFSKACSVASRPKKSITDGSDGKGGLKAIKDRAWS